MHKKRMNQEVKRKRMIRKLMNLKFRRMNILNFAQLLSPSLRTMTRHIHIPTNSMSLVPSMILSINLVDWMMEKCSRTRNSALLVVCTRFENLELSSSSTMSVVKEWKFKLWPTPNFIQVKKLSRQIWRKFVAVTSSESTDIQARPKKENCRWFQQR